jgi:hypothetical protein
MINQYKLRDIVGKIIRINSFNLEEYQDKYYFQKKVQEIIPEISNREIYWAIETLLAKGTNFNNKEFVSDLSNKLYMIYLNKENVTTRR